MEQAFRPFGCAIRGDGGGLVTVTQTVTGTVTSMRGGEPKPLFPESFSFMANAKVLAAHVRLREWFSLMVLNQIPVLRCRRFLEHSL